jgi:hypothetical protein
MFHTATVPMSVLQIWYCTVQKVATGSPLLNFSYTFKILSVIFLFRKVGLSTGKYCTHQWEGVRWYLSSADTVPGTRLTSSPVRYLQLTEGTSK